MITGTVTYDLRRNSYEADRREIGTSLYVLPSGVRVILDVGCRDIAHPWTVDQLRQYVDRVHFDVHGSVEAVASWVAALRGESPSDIARWSA
ncbi:hypothetical protein [Nocardioides zeae]